MGVHVAPESSLTHCFFTYFATLADFLEAGVAAKRVTMRKIRDILRLKFAGELSIRQIHRSTKVSVGAIQKLLVRAGELDLSWPLPDNMDDSELAIVPVGLS